MSLQLSFTGTGPVVDTINSSVKKFTENPPWTSFDDFIQSIVANPPWVPFNSFIQGLVNNPPWAPVNSFVKGLVSNPPWAPFNSFVQGLVNDPPWAPVNEVIKSAGTPSLQTVVTYLKELNDRLPAKMLTSGSQNQLLPYCGMAASYAGSRLPAGTDKISTIPAGVPVTLTALAPLPGTSLPAVDKFAAGSIPTSSVVTFQWHVSLAEADGSSWKPGAFDCRPGSTLDDVGGAFECVSGSLTSPILEVIPWPDPNHDTSNDVSTPSKTVRKFAAYLDISIWWPGLSQVTVVSTPPVFFGVQSWNDVFSGSVDKDKGVWKWDKATPDPAKGQVFAHQFFDGLFNLAVDDIAPAAGKIVAATITRADYKPVLPQTVSSIVQRDPNLKIQAGLDVGAVLNSFKNVGNLITGSHGSNSTAFDSALSVSQVLSNALSIPIAVAVNGTDLAKTIVPNAPITLPNMVSSPDASALAGIIPIGKLMTRIESKLDDEHLSVADVEGVLRQGLSFLPVPVFRNLSARALLSGPTVTISISLKANITVPGAAKPLKLNYDIGSFSIRRPVIPVPQMALMFSAPLLGAGSNQIQDALIVPDPIVRSLLGSTDALKSALGTLDQTITTVRSLVPLFSSITSSIPDFDNVANTVSLMVQYLANTAANGKSLDLIGPYSRNDVFNNVETNVIASELPVDRWWDGRNTDNHGNNISAFLYIGAAGNQDWQMRMGIDDFHSPVGRMFMPPNGSGNAVRAVRFMGPGDMSEGVTFKLRDNSLERRVGTDLWKDWDDRIRWVEWLPPN